MHLSGLLLIYIFGCFPILLIAHTISMNTLIHPFLLKSLNSQVYTRNRNAGHRVRLMVSFGRYCEIVSQGGVFHNLAFPLAM